MTIKTALTGLLACIALAAQTPKSDPLGLKGSHVVKSSAVASKDCPNWIVTWPYSGVTASYVSLPTQMYIDGPKMAGDLGYKCVDGAWQLTVEKAEQVRKANEDRIAEAERLVKLKRHLRFALVSRPLTAFEMDQVEEYGADLFLNSGLVIGYYGSNAAATWREQEESLERRFQAAMLTQFRIRMEAEKAGR